MHLINILNDFRLILNFIDTMNIIILFNATIDFVIKVYNKKLLKILFN